MHLPQRPTNASIPRDIQTEEPAMPRQPVRDIVIAASLTFSMAACASSDATQSYYDGSYGTTTSDYGGYHNGTAVYGVIPGSGIELSWDDRDALGRIAYAEAGNQGQLGIIAVVYTIFNRVASGQFQSTIQDVIDAPNQFEPSTRVGGWRNLPPLSGSRGVEFDSLLDQILAGNLPDPTNGALFFQNARIVAARAARGKGSWALVDFGGTPPVAEIGDHRFYDWRAAINLAAARASDAYPASDGYSSNAVAALNGRSLDGSLSSAYVQPDYSSQAVADLNARSLEGGFSGYSAEPDYSSQAVADLNARSLEGGFSSYSYYAEPDYSSQEVADLNTRSLEGGF